ncbi:MAG: hypothetical protein AMJ46_07565 [Latescibacteria bacterium DG_63]|nr:MAG: hypothetical protein AMJ46_07565 [Latescibacteria bacterium DG_63]
MSTVRAMARISPATVPGKWATAPMARTSPYTVPATSTELPRRVMSSWMVCLASTDSPEKRGDMNRRCSQRGAWLCAWHAARKRTMIPRHVRIL